MSGAGSMYEVSLRTLVLGEITQVTSLMRKNARWAGQQQRHHGSNGGSNSSRAGTPNPNAAGPSTSSSMAASSSSSSSSLASSSTSTVRASTVNSSLISNSSAATLVPPESGSIGSNGEAFSHLGLRAQKSRERINKASSSNNVAHNTQPPSGKDALGSAGLRSTSMNSQLPVPGDLLSGFAILRDELKTIEDPRQLDAIILLSPFLDVVRSGDTSGPITAIALSSVDKFITYGLVHRDSPNLAAAMTAVAGAGTHCKFEASDSVSDEVVLLKILNLLKNTLTSDLGNVLSDEAVCEMMETGLSMCCQMRLSEMLRRSSERNMQAMLISVFRRIHSIPSPPSSSENSALTAFAESQSGASTPSITGAEDQSIRMTAPDPTSADIPAASTPAYEHPITPSRRTSSYGLPQPPKEIVSVPTSPPLGTIDEDMALPEVKPYGLASIREILRVLISLLNPHDQTHTDSMRLVALGLLNIAFEVGGASISRFPSLRTMIADELCKYLFQLARSESVLLLANSLRVISNVFDTMREHLKLQQELFLSFLMDRLIKPSGNMGTAARKGEMESELDASTWNSDETSPMIVKGVHSPLMTSTNRRGSGSLAGNAYGSRQAHSVMVQQSESRDLMLEYLAQFATADDFMTNLWTNYDCNVDCEDLFERIIKFFSRGVYPSGSTSPNLQDHSQLVCLDTLLTFVNSMTTRLNEAGQSIPLPQEIDPAALAAAKASKRNLLEGALRFNEKPKDGISFLEAKGLIYTEENADLPRHEVLARFLKNCPRLDKKLLGDYISRPDNIAVLKSFIGLFDFRDKVMSDAMRELLEAFRLPGEAQQIDRITETFAHAYVEVNKNEVRTSDAAYVLAFSIIMLNTDLHSPVIRKRMTLEDYSRNLKGVNDKEDFPQEYLKAVYDGIRKREMVMPEEHVGILGFEYAWKELLRRASTAGRYLVCHTDHFDKSVFTLSWKPVISALSYAFTHFTDDFMLQRAIAGFQQCATLAHRFGLPEVFDYIIHSLSKITTLAGPQGTLESSTTFPTIDIDGQTVTVSALALRFGTSFKAQLAAVVLFSIANDNASSIEQSWIDIFEVYHTLFAHSLLPQSLLNMEEFLAGTPAIPLKVRVETPAPEEKRRNDGGLLSTLSSYLLSPYAHTPDGIGRDVTEDDIEHTLSTIDCIASCRVDTLYSTIISLPADALGVAVMGLVDLNERATLVKIRERTYNAVSSSPSISINKTQLDYDPSSVFMLELMMSIAAEAEHAVPETWPVIFDFVSKVLASCQSFHTIYLERVVTGLLRMTSLIARRESMRDQVFVALNVLHTLPSHVMTALSEQVAVGLSRVLMENPTGIKSATEWNLVFSLWSSTASKEEAAAVSFDMISSLSSGNLGSGLNADNFVGFIRVLNDFATTASSGDLKYRNSASGAGDPVVARGRQALEMIRDAQSLVNELIQKSSLNAAAAWETYWLPVLTVYSQQSVNGCREIRQTALANLQRTLIANEVLSNAEVDLIMVFERLIFPMLDELLKPQVFRRDPEGMGETRLRASALLCKIFLHYLIQLSERQGMAGMTELWMKILGYLDRFMHSGRRDHMYEAVPESLKNVLLVMHASGFLVPPHQTPRTDVQANLWDATFDRLDIFLPILRQDLFPTPVATRSSQLALQPAPVRSPSPTPPSSSQDSDSVPNQAFSSLYL